MSAPALRHTAICMTLAAAALNGQAQDTASNPSPHTAIDFARDVVVSNDADGMDFAVLDKAGTTLWVFDRQGALLAQSPVLIGQAVGDWAPDDIGTRPFSRIRPSEKTTSAGRYVTEPGVNLQGEDIVWLDYDAALSMHRVRNVPGESRPQRLQTPSIEDNRISFGCINMPPAFYEQHIAPHFGQRQAVVYVLPETVGIAQFFPFARTTSALQRPAK